MELAGLQLILIVSTHFCGVQGRIMKRLIRNLLVGVVGTALLGIYTAGAQATYTIGGNVGGLASGKSVTLLNNGTSPFTVSVNGGFTFPVAVASGPYSVTVAIQPVGQTCSVSGGAGTVINANITNVNVTCSDTYTVGGSVTGLTASGLVLRMNSANLIVAIGATAFKFSTALVSGTNYAVSVSIQPVGQTCTVNNGIGTVGVTNVTSVSVSCASAYTVGGTVTGLSVSGLVLRLNNSSSLIVPNGAASFKFSTGLVTGASYAVTVSNQPTGQTCLLTNSSGIIGSANVVSVGVSCSTNPVMTLTSSVGVNGGTLPSAYTCDGFAATIDLAWSNVPAGTQEFALMMTTLPGDGSTRWNWVLYYIPVGVTSLVKDSFGVGTLGQGSDGPIVRYQPPCSIGPDAKLYTYTLYALSAIPDLSAFSGPVTGEQLTSAIAGITLGSAKLDLSYTRNFLGSSSPCLNVRNSTNGAVGAKASVSCDGTYAYVGGDALATDPMMNGIVATNLQVPTGQRLLGFNAWKIPLAPVENTGTKVAAVDGPIGVAVNGVPIFNPCKQGGCDITKPNNNDTKVAGELDICNGHAGRADDYHYHAAPTCLMAGQSDPHYWDTHPVGWALDGYAIMGYNDATGTVATRDAICGGNTALQAGAAIPAGYSYHVTDASPYVLSCFYGVPSPDLAGQAAKFQPTLRKDPVKPFPDSSMTLTTDTNSSSPNFGYKVLQFTSAVTFVTNELSGATNPPVSDRYTYTPGTYRILYKQLGGAELVAAMAVPGNAGKTSCWKFKFQTDSGAPSGSPAQPDITYCH
jgi:phosphatidylethanolamine-binding protein (PEBP) family uncharacterized protein